MASLPLVPPAPRSSVEMSPTSYERDGLRVEIASAANIPSEFGHYKLVVFRNNQDNKEHLAMLHGDVFGMHDVITRVHSECLTGDVMASLRCDCRPQLERAMRTVATAPRGIVLYMRQEGRGIGLTNKIRAYALQETGMDTVDANLALGFKDDERRYDVAAAMLRTLGVRSVSLMTNNPDKVNKLEQAGINVRTRLPHAIAANDHNRAYLETKAKKSGHLLNVIDLAGE
jgi:GTP cyclohydrolase II